METIYQQIANYVRDHASQFIVQIQGQVTPAPHDILDHTGFPGGTTDFLREDGSWQPSGAGTPSATVADLDGSGNAGASSDYSRGDHKHADANRPTDDEKDALAGTGTPSAGNRYVTDDDSRLGGGPGGLVIAQVVTTQTGAVATGTTTIDLDDTIPQKTEGTEFMTLAITPTNAYHTLRIDVTAVLSNDGSDRWMIVGLFQDSANDALATVVQYMNTGTGMMTITFSHSMTAGTTSSTTFRVRAGANSTGTTTFNGRSGGRQFGGTIPSSITITEIIP